MGPVVGAQVPNQVGINMRQLLLSHLVSKLNSLDIYNIFIDMKTQISKCFVSAHTVMDRVCSNAEFLFFNFFSFLERGW